MQLIGKSPPSQRSPWAVELASPTVMAWSPGRAVTVCIMAVEVPMPAIAATVIRSVMGMAALLVTIAVPSVVVIIVSLG